MFGAVAPSASAQTAPGYEEFAGCPNVPTVISCLRNETTSGHIQIGNTNTPINRKIVLSGGLELATGSLVFNQNGGLSAPPLNVPGGLSGLTGLPEFLINLLTLGAHQVEAQAILVGTPQVVTAEDLEVTLPLRLRLINPFLRSSCSIGSAANPVVLHLTTGTTSPPPPNQPITGTIVPAIDDPATPQRILSSSGNVLVDNAFGAPQATGCDLIGFGLINGLVNARVGLPSAAGRNTAVLSSTTLKLAARRFVYP
jgi:hypothetical protein